MSELKTKADIKASSDTQTNTNTNTNTQTCANDAPTCLKKLAAFLNTCHDSISKWWRKTTDSVRTRHTTAGVHHHTHVNTGSNIWFTLLAIVILSRFVEMGILDEYPSIQWMVESGMRLLDAIFELLHNVLEWAFEKHNETGPFSDTTLMRALDPIFKWVEEIFGY